MHQKKLDSTQEEYIIEIELWEQYHSICCWTSFEMANDIFCQLKSETAKLNVKEQILICHLGLGWTKAHHRWSIQVVVYSSCHILKHFIENILPMAETNEVPSDLPINFPMPPADTQY